MANDRIEKKIVLRAPLERVWLAISDAKRFGSWFGVAFDGPFVEGERVSGRIVPTTVDEEVAKSQKPHEGLACDFWVERIEPMRRFSFRWHPGVPEPGAELRDDEMTTIVFELEEVEGGVRLTITESGFDRVPLERRAKAFASNEGGWEAQTTLIAKYLALDADG